MCVSSSMTLANRAARARAAEDGSKRVQSIPAPTMLEEAMSRLGSTRHSYNVSEHTPRELTEEAEETGVKSMNLGLLGLFR